MLIMRLQSLIFDLAVGLQWTRGLFGVENAWTSGFKPQFIIIADYQWYTILW
jgi:hypothetical protein